MRKKVFQWLGKEFIALSCEGRAGMTATEEGQEVLRRFDQELRGAGLSLGNTVRTRLWGIDKESRTLAGAERTKILSGKARAPSSSYISQSYFDSDAHVALDLLAMRPLRQGVEKILKEYDPPMVPPRYLTYDSVVFLSGVTAGSSAFADQVVEILSAISGSLTDARTSWNKVVGVSFFLHRSQRLENLKELFQKTINNEIPQMEYLFVDGYAREGRLLEIEVTATL